MVKYGKTLFGRAKNMDMTSGGIMGKLIAFSLPLALSGILQLLFNAVDLIVIGQFSQTSKESVAAISSNNALISLIINVSLGLSVGANVVVAHAIGSRNKERAQNAVHTAILMSVICGVAVGLIGALCARYFLVWMKTDANVIDKATTYLSIYFIGAPANIVYNFGAAILRAKGDTKRPLMFLALSGVINACLNLILVKCAHMDVAGVAIATIVSQYISVALVIITLAREKEYCKLNFKKLRIKKRELLDILRVGLPSGILSSFFSVANVIIQSSINGFGAAVMAGNGVGASLEAFVYTSMNAVSSAATTFAGQNAGAKRYDRMKSILLDSSVVTILISVVLGAFIYFLGKPLAGLYTQDPTVVDLAIDRMSVILPIYFICGIVENVVGCLRGMNYAIIPMIPSFLSVCAYRIIWVYTAFRKSRTTLILYLSYPISWIINLVLDAGLFAYAYNKVIRVSKTMRDDSRSLEYVRVG
ncbi:MAG: MATE family efflux transporter [Bacteroides sp.]|nr:MATE family efflux transporter [Bacillota bacterium]MCM1393851.1 MATE family efflux transporter [[Eubacterium] siraeum]MCM1455025.1 MATE family efflux transporter [Bacteroides sp.]